MIQVQLCGVALLMAIIILNFSHRTVQIRTQTYFKDVLYIALLSVVLDTGSIVLLSSENGYSFVALLVCKTYLVSLIFEVYASLMYLLSGLDYLYKGINAYKTLMGFVAIIASAVVTVTPIEVSVTGRVAYTYGMSVDITYVVGLFYIFSIAAFLTFAGKNLDKRRKLVSFIWIVLWMAATAGQYYFKDIMLISYTGCLGVAILFVKLENPESYIDMETGLLNQMSLSRYIRDRASQHKKFSTIVIIIEDLHKSVDLDIIEGAEKTIAKYMDSVPNTTAFHNHGMKYTLLVDKVQETGNVLAEVQKKMNDVWKFRSHRFTIKARCYVIPNINMDAEKYERMSGIFISDKQSHTVTPTCYMDESWLKEYERNEEYAEIIEEAIKEDRVTLYFQPIYDVKNKVFHSAEVLVRIVAKDGQVLAPDSFIPVAEANDSIVELGELIFRKACEYLASVDAKKLGIKYLEINVSAIQSTTEDLAERFIAIMEKNGIRPDQINLEITESAALRSKEVLLNNMKKLIDYGVSFSLDDFGTGFSNLNYILELPVEIVKLDHHMTQAYFSGEKGKLIMEAVIHMIQAVGMKIVAEGVDTKEQVELLAPEHIDYIQGYYFTKPLPMDQYESFLLENNQIAP